MTIGLILCSIGGLIAFIGAIWIIVLAFQESVAWGICSLCIPLVGIVFAIMHWNKCSKPFLIWLTGAILGGIGYAMIISAVINDPELQRQLKEIQQKQGR